MISIEQARDLMQHAELIRTAQEVQAAVARVAEGINAKLADRHPLVLSVMGGAVVFTGQILPMLTFPLDFDILQATRYGEHTSGQTLTWRVEPRENIMGRDVLVLDDILDEGITLAAIRDRVIGMGAARVLTAVFCNKELGRAKPVVADFCGISVPDRYVFGFGMDAFGLWRNLPAVYALRD
jgi:hypoxanthine phosphoribosyltransferase